MPSIFNVYQKDVSYNLNDLFATFDGEITGAPQTITYDDVDNIFQNDSSAGASEEVGQIGQVLSGTNTTIFIDGTWPVEDQFGNQYILAELDVTTAGGVNTDGEYIVFFPTPLPPGNVLNFSDAVVVPPGSIINSTGGFNSQSTITCFTSGTEILTKNGPISIDELSLGDKVSVLSSAQKEILWMKRRTISRKELYHNPNLRPVHITAGALGQGLPHKDLILSQQHRIMVSSKIAQRMFGNQDVLIPAKKLTDLPGIYIDNSCEEITYVHFALDEHSIVFAQGAPTESLYLGAEALDSFTQTQREELQQIFPNINIDDPKMQPAKHIPLGHQQKQFIARHLKNKRPLLAQWEPF